FLMAELRLDGASDAPRVKVRNLSAGGMMAEGDAKVERGARLSVNLRNIGWIEGNVAWVQDNRFGIAFEKEVDPALARLPASNPDEMSTPRFVRSTATYSSQDQSNLRKI
ncbi:PilZ domain-containing protein, partial [Altererythrobacter sp.]|nr:PilZ domain-containing protein [Altererythrobacter sp.]